MLKGALLAALEFLKVGKVNASQALQEETRHSSALQLVSNNIVTF